MKTVTIIPPQKSLDAEVVVPGSKSYTNRALLLAALAGGTVEIKNPLVSDDTKAMADCLGTLGVKCSFKKNSVEVSGDMYNIADRAYDLDANLSGTTIRFLLALACVIPGIKTIRGRGRLNERPVQDLVDALRQLGASIQYEDKEGFPPLRVSSSKLSAGTIKMNGSVSSQFLSAVIMIAPVVGNVVIEVEGEQVSKPYVDMTIDTMRSFGVEVANHRYKKYTVKAGQKYHTDGYTVEGDVSSASYFFAVAALTKSRITLKNMNPNSAQADMGFLKILQGMGNEVTYGDNEITLQGRGVKPVGVDMQDCPDQAQTLAVLAAFARGTTTISGVASLRVKETERVVAVERELAKMGIRTSSTPDTLTIHGGAPKPASIDTYGDHRMAMAFAVAGSTLAGMEIRDPEVVEKTFPDFWEKLASIGVRLEFGTREPNIVLVGMRGSGKSTIARILSKKLGRECVEVDDLLVQRAGMSIRDIVAEHGWEHFRDLESDMAQEVAAKKGVIISTGGGIVTRPRNIAILKENGVCIFLKAPADVLIRRMGEDDPRRPRLLQSTTPRQEVKRLLGTRTPLYEDAADITVDAGVESAGETAEEILQKLAQKGIV